MLKHSCVIYYFSQQINTVFTFKVYAQISSG